MIKYFYKFDILHDVCDTIFIVSLEDDWYMISFREFNGDDYYSYYYICDGCEGLEKFIDDKI